MPRMIRVDVVNAVVALMVSTAAYVGAQVPPERCALTEMNTATWRTVQSYALGIEFSVPQNYVRKDWENRSDSTDVSLHFWRDGRPVNSVTISALNKLSAGHLVATPEASTRTCAMDTRGGPLSITLEDTQRPIGGNEWAPHFEIKAQLSLPKSKATRVFYATSSDTTIRAEQLAILRSIRFLGVHREK